MARPSWIGETLGGRYVIEKMIGKGGMASVYQANDPNLRRVVAIKMIHPHLTDDPSFVRRFMEEAATVAQFRHPNIVQVYDFNHDEDVYYIVFEFIPGETLGQRLRRLAEDGRKMNPKEAALLAAKIADALDYAHKRNLVHRDIKPGNVMINMHSEPILMDFGIVKIVGGTQHTATGATVGTARYMAPEQIRSENIDGRTDIYSLGIVLYEMLAGRVPFQADSAMTTMMMHITDPVPDVSNFRPEIPPDLQQLVARCLAKNPDMRYQSAAEMAAALRAVDWSAQPTAVPLPSAQPTIVEPLAAAAVAGAAAGAATGSGAQAGTVTPGTRASIGATTGGAAAPPAGPATPPAAQRSGGNRTPLLAAGIGGALLLLLLVCVAGVFAVNALRGDDGGTPVAEATETATATMEATEEATEAVTKAATGVATDAPEATIAPTDIATDEPPPTTAPTATSPPATATSVPPTATSAPPTATTEPAPTATPELGVAITGITLNGSTYVVSYETFGYTEQLPGMHIHFFFNTVPPEQAGVPGNGPWFLYGGPRPFTGYTTADRPAQATQMCVLVARADHSVFADSGNCWNLPDA